MAPFGSLGEDAVKKVNVTLVARCDSDGISEGGDNSGTDVVCDLTWGGVRGHQGGDTVVGLLHQGLHLVFPV